jgi:hypothetical protein
MRKRFYFPIFGTKKIPILPLFLSDSVLLEQISEIKRKKNKIQSPLRAIILLFETFLLLKIKKNFDDI